MRELEALSARVALLERSERLYRQWFEDAPISLWEQDYSKVKQRVDEIRAQDVGDMEAYFQSHPELVVELASRVRLVDVNKATIRLYKATRKEDFLQGIEQVLSKETYKSFVKNLLTIAEGKLRFFDERVHTALNGEIFQVQVYWAVASGYEDDYGRVLVSVVDVTELKRAEWFLEQKSEEQRTLLDTIPVQVWYLSDPNTYGPVNWAYSDFLGLHPRDVAHRHLREVLPAHVAESTIARNREAFEMKAPIQTEEWLPDGKGVHRLIDIIRTPRLTPEGQVELVVCSGVDITAQRETEAALRESERKYRLIADNMADTVWIMDMNMRFTYVSPSVSRMYGTTVEEMLGKPIAPSLTPESFKVVSKAFAEEMEREAQGTADPDRIRTLELEEYKAGGSTIWVESSMSFLRDEANKAIGIIGVSRDISDRRGAEEALRRSEAFLNETGKIARVGGWEINLDTNTVTWTKAVRAIYEVADDYVPTVEEAISFFAPEKRTNLAEAIRKAREEGIAYDMELPFITATGRRLWTRAVGIPEFRDGTCGRLYGIFQDISEQKRAEEEQEKLQAQLLQAQKMESVGRLAGGVAHDFNNIIQAIMGRADLALFEMSQDHPAYADIQEICNATKRSTSIIDQLLAFARKQVISPVPIDFNDAIGRMLKMLRRLIGESTDLSWVPGANLWQVKMDPSQVDQVLINLVVNARDAIQDVGRVTIETQNVALDETFCSCHPGSVSGEYVRLSVSDNGVGMDAETLKSIFEPFFTTKEVGKGTGLGLAMVYGIVKQNNGYIHVESQPGHGSYFQIYLPKQEKEVEMATDHMVPPQPAKGSETVLLVEDQPSVLETGKRLLTALGYTVLPANRPDYAIRLAEEYAGEIHLLMTDVVMPGMNGMTLASHLQAQNPSLKCLLMSGYAAEVSGAHAEPGSPLHFIQKPFTLETLSTKLREVLESTMEEEARAPDPDKP